MNTYNAFRIRTQNLKRIQQCLTSRLRYSTSAEDKIEIPNRIPRGPTDILRALESTVTRDPTAAHYKYHDDPYLIPLSNVSKRTYAMAQEAGRKAAHWIRKEHAELFNHNECEPPVEKFFPKLVYTNENVESENDLKNLINDVQVSDAFNVYKICKEKGIPISEETNQALLELLCYYNSQDTLDDEFIEERWFRQSSRSKERDRKTWLDGGFAEELFISIENPTAETYSCIIQGMAKHLQVERAWQLFEESQQKGLVLNTNTYNSLIAVANVIREGYEQRWAFVQNLLIDLNKAKLTPNLGTLNAVLSILSTMGSGKITKEYTLKTLAEFQNLGIHPSLASWNYVLKTFCKERGPVSSVLNDIMKLIENKEFKIQDLKDINFFVTAMDVCKYHLHDVELAKRVNALLYHGNNYNLIGDSYKESVYYRNYITLLCENLPLDEFMANVYDKYVPNIYVPEPIVMEEILNVIDLNGAIKYIPKLWTDMTVFDHIRRENLLNSVLNIMVNNKPQPESDLNLRLSEIAWNIYNFIENENENRANKLRFTGDILGKLMILLLRNKDFDKASMIMDKLDQGHAIIVGVPKLDALSLYVDCCIEEKLPSRAITCIQYCSESGYSEAASLAARLNEKLTLDEKHLNKLSDIVGSVGLKKDK